MRSPKATEAVARQRRNNTRSASVVGTSANSLFASQKSRLRSRPRSVNQCAAQLRVLMPTAIDEKQQRVHAARQVKLQFAVHRRRLTVDPKLHSRIATNVESHDPWRQDFEMGLHGARAARRSFCQRQLAGHLA